MLRGSGGIFPTLCVEFCLVCFVLCYRLFSTTGSQLPLASDVGTSDQKIMLKLFDHAFESAE